MMRELLEEKNQDLRIYSRKVLREKEVSRVYKSEHDHRRQFKKRWVWKGILCVFEAEMEKSNLLRERKKQENESHDQNHEMIVVDVRTGGHHQLLFPFLSISSLDMRCVVQITYGVTKKSLFPSYLTEKHEEMQWCWDRKSIEVVIVTSVAYNSVMGAKYI